MPLTKEILSKYNYNDIFVETGTYHGEGIRIALQTGFKEIHSVEYSSLFFGKACFTFSAHSNVKLYLGNSIAQLPIILSDIREPVTFWLDAHDNNYHSPLLNELDIIAQHEIKEHTILMDDVDDFERYGWTVDTVQKKILTINSDYKFKIIQVKRQILIAEI